MKILYIPLGDQLAIVKYRVTFYEDPIFEKWLSLEKKHYNDMTDADKNLKAVLEASEQPIKGTAVIDEIKFVWQSDEPPVSLHRTITSHQYNLINSAIDQLKKNAADETMQLHQCVADYYC